MATHVRFPIDRSVRDDLGHNVGDFFESSEVPLTSGGANGADEESVRLTIKQPTATEIMVRPIFAGVFFFAKSASAKLMLKPNGEIDVDASGTLAVKRFDLKEFGSESDIPILERTPTVAWYSDVRLSVRFLLRLPSIMQRGKIPVRVPDGDPPFSYGDSNAGHRLIQYFFDGQLGIPFRAADLDADMPIFDFQVKSGEFKAELKIRLAVERTTGRFKPDFHPLEEAYEFISPRIYLRSLMEQKLLLLEAQDPVADLVLGGERTLLPWRRSLEQGLTEIGILLASEDATNNAPIKWALREFQIYASRPNIAVATNDPSFKFGVQGAPNSHRYSRHVSGCANRDTRRALSSWRELSYRCPLIMLAFATSDIQKDVPKADPKAVNFWKRSKPENWTDEDDLKFIKYHSVFAADLTGFFGATIKKIEFGSIIKVGSRVTVELEDRKHKKYRVTGPLGNKPGKREATPENVLGKKTADVLSDPVMKSRFRVFRAVCEQESEGYLDIHNAWDDVFLSLAPFHWSMSGLTKGGTELGEFVLALKNEGLSPALLEWGFDTIKTEPLNRADPKQTAFLCFLSDDGFPTPIVRRNEAAYLSSWHVYTRFLSLSRNDPKNRYGKAAWAMVMHRINAILSSKWSNSLKFRDVLTSELLVAAIVRAHVFRPSWIISDGGASPLMIAMKAAAADSDQNGMFNALLELLKKEDKRDATSLRNSLIRLQKPIGAGFKIDPRLRLLDAQFENGDGSSEKHFTAE